MTASLARLELETLLTLDERGRIVSTREPEPAIGPRFILIRDRVEAAWAPRTDIPDPVIAELHELVTTEPLLSSSGAPPAHASRYESLVGGRPDAGPTFLFPPSLRAPNDAVLVDDLSLIQCHFRGWTAEELAGRAPIYAVLEADAPVSLCFSARRTTVAAEAGVETTPRHRGRGFAGRVVAAWAAAVRVSGRLPFYSTSWGNAASLAVARKLELELCASHWSLVD